MMITRTCTLTQTVNTMDLPVTDEQMSAWESGVFIQEAMPDLPAEYREFIKTGVTPETWNNMFDFNEEDDEK